MTEIEFKWLTEPLAVLLTGKGVFIVSIVIAVIFGFIYYKNRSRQLLNSLPGLFTSLGLLGTFVAICNSLGDINQDTLEIDTIIRNLVPAFTSSIAGLILRLSQQQDVRYGIHMKTGNWKRKLTYKHLKSVCITLPCCQLQQMNLYQGFHSNL